MISRVPRRLGALAFLLLVVVVTVPVAGQAPSTGVARPAPATRTASASRLPDLDGVWSNNGVTPLQRPEVLKDREYLTPAEVEELKRRAVELFDSQQAGDLIGDRIFREIVKDPSLRPFDPDTGNYNSFWLADRSIDNRTSLIIDPSNGRLPPRVPQQPDAARRAPPPGAGAASAGPSNPEDLGLNERCITYGVPWLIAGYNSYIQIFQTPTYVAILQEMIHDVRIVPLDGRPHVDSDVRLWNGDSRGHYDGDTLVVTTTNYSSKTRLQGSSENLKLIERFRRVGPDTLEYTLTFDDPTVWTGPWTMMIPLKRSSDQIYEYACHEGNHSLTGILAGARTLEKEAAQRR
jgi:hypothetical protein